jgi:hypothetical protein
VIANRSLWIACGLVVSLAGFLPDACAEEDLPPAIKPMERVWSLPGAWTGVAGDEREGVIYAIRPGGKCVEVDEAGKTRREFQLAGAGGGSLLRLANWPGEAGRALLTFGVWSADLQAHDLQGKLLWTYARDSGIDDVWATTVQGGKAGGVIVGFNGGTGAHVLDSQGQLLWKTTALGNVWHVSAGDVLGEGSPQVVTTSAVGKVHVIEADFKERHDLDAGCYANMVRVGKLSESDKKATIFVAGSLPVPGDKQKTEIFITALAGDGVRKWSLELPADNPPHVDSALLAPGKPWLALGMRGGQVHVLDAENGVKIASVKDQGLITEVGWTKVKGSENPLLLVGTQGSLNAFRVVGAEK